MRSIEFYRELGEPVLTDRWRITQFPDIEVTSGENSRTFFGRNLAAYCRSIPVNWSNTPSAALYGAGTNGYYCTDVNDIDGFTCIFSLTEKTISEIVDYFVAWKSLLVDGNGFRALPQGENGYKQNIEFQLHNSRGQTLLTYLYSGVFPTDTDAFQLETGTDAIEFTQAFSVDGGEVVSTHLPQPDLVVPGRFGRVNLYNSATGTYEGYGGHFPLKPVNLASLTPPTAGG